VSYRSTALRTWNENILFSALVELTYRCNLDCFFCYNDLGLSGEPMRLPDYERFFEDLASLSCLHLTLSGGEPLAHPEFFEVGRKARALGFVVRVKSNGHGIRGEVLRRLQDEVDPLVVEVSLHGAVAQTHDRQTRVPGSFTRLLSNLAEMKAAGLRFKINSTLTRWNEREIEGMFALADRFGALLTIDPEVTARDDGDRSPLEIKASPEGLRRLGEHRTRRHAAAPGTDDAIARRGDAEAPAFDSKKHCGAGSSGIAVDPFGNVYPCVQWRRPVGNLHERSIRDIWVGNPDLEEVRRLSAVVKERVAGTGLLSFCPGAAESLTGSPLPPAGSELLPLHPSNAAQEEMGPWEHIPKLALAGGTGVQIAAIASRGSR
jgi:radical SAM protein with 4Fe4S-binding SPASM domain